MARGTSLVRPVEPRLDAALPLALGLLWHHLGGGRLVGDLAGRRAGSPVGADRTVTQSGPATRIDANGEYVAWSSAHGGPPLTLALLGTVTAVGHGSAGIVCLRSASGIYGLVHLGGIGAVRAIWTASDLCSLSKVAGRRYLYVARFEAGRADLTLCSREAGLQRSSYSGSLGGWSWTDSWRLGIDALGAVRTSHGSFEADWGWSRWLSDAEILALWSDPWQLARPRHDMLRLLASGMVTYVGNASLTGTGTVVAAGAASRSAASAMAAVAALDTLPRRVRARTAGCSAVAQMLAAPRLVRAGGGSFQPAGSLAARPSLVRRGVIGLVASGLVGAMGRLAGAVGVARLRLSHRPATGLRLGLGPATSVRLEHHPATLLRLGCEPVEE